MSLSRATLWGVAAGVLAHVLLSVSFQLSPDEAHYALYAAHLDWSYYDHPPMVGWLQWPFWQLGGSDVVMRLVPMGAWALTAWLLARLTRQLYPEQKNDFASRAAGWALGLLGLSLLPHLLAIALVPDSLMMPLTCAVMVSTWRLCRTESVQRTGLWLQLGLLLGLAGLSKYTAVLLALGVVLALWQAHGLRLLARKGPWLAMLTAALCVLPVFYWNLTHDWASFHYQLNHAAGGSEWLWLNALRFTLVIWLAYGLLLPWALVKAWRAGATPFTTQAVTRVTLSAERFCLSFGLPSLMLWVYLSGRGSTLPHWAAPAVVALLPMAGAGCALLRDKHARWLTGLAGVQALLCVAMAALMVSGGAAEPPQQAKSDPGALEKSAPNPFADLYGWREAAEHARALAQQQGANTLAVMNWTLASRIAWYARPMPVKVVNSHQDQFDLWFGTVQPQDRVLLLDWSLMSFAPPVGPQQFSECEPIDQTPVLHGGRQIAHFHYLMCSGWQSGQKGATP